MDLVVGVGDPAGQLGDVQAIGHEREGLGVVVAGVDLAAVVVNRTSAESRRRARFEPPDPKAQPQQCGADAGRGSLAGSPAWRLCLARVHDGLQERTGGDDHGRCPVDEAAAYPHAGHEGSSCGAGFGEDIFHLILSQVQIVLLFQDAFDLLLIGLLVGLGPGAVHGRAFAAVEHAELQAGGVGDTPHRTAQGIDFSSDLSLGDSADRRVAAHLSHGIEVGCQQSHVRAETRGSQRGLRTCVPAADHEDVVGAHGHPHRLGSVVTRAP